MYSTRVPARRRAEGNVILGLIWDAMFSAVGVGFGLFWQAHGHPYGGAFMLVAGGYMFGMLTTSRSWRRVLRPLVRNQPAPRSGT